MKSLILLKSGFLKPKVKTCFLSLKWNKRTKKAQTSPIHIDKEAPSTPISNTPINIKSKHRFTIIRTTEAIPASPGSESVLTDTTRILYRIKIGVKKKTGKRYKPNKYFIFQLAPSKDKNGDLKIKEIIVNISEITKPTLSSFLN